MMSPICLACGKQMRDAGQDSRKLREWKYLKETQDNVGQQGWQLGHRLLGGAGGVEPGEATASSQTQDTFSGATLMLWAPED